MGIDHAKLKQRLASRTVSGWRPQPGDNRIRILPPHSSYLTNWEALEDLSIAYKIHFFRIEGRQAEVSRCLEELKKRCPACEMWRTHRKATDPALAEMADNVKPADQYLFTILDINNIQVGLQHWASNWTCWQKIMELAANPQWGNLVDPANGVTFNVNMTAAKQSRTGYNAYSVMPEPQRTTIMKILAGIPDWHATLDDLESQIPPAKEPAEIAGLLSEMGFPARSAVAVNPASAPPAATPAAVTTLAPEPVGVAAPEVAGGGAVAPVEEVVAPQPIVAEQQPIAPAPAATLVDTAEIHYDPGPGYTPKLADADRPAGTPRCFGDYNPGVHKCDVCPAMADCQIQFMGVEQ